MDADRHLALEAHRTALTGHCYRMLGSAAEADDAVQETMLRAWPGLDRFEERASLRTWLHRIATRVCLDALGDRSRRGRPMELGPAGSVDDPLTALPGERWIEPIPDAAALPAQADPAERAMLRQSIRLAFVAALQHLPPRQRAALLLTEVLGWTAAEVAGAIDGTAASRRAPSNPRRPAAVPPRRRPRWARRAGRGAHGRKGSIMKGITPFLWFDHQAEEAARFYVSVFEGSKLGDITRYGPEGPGKEGSVMTVGFEVAGQAFVALNGGPLLSFTQAVSFVVNCETQREVDDLWEKLPAGGGKVNQCGWLTDRYGVPWQVVPVAMTELMRSGSPQQCSRMMKAMLRMKKLDLATLQQAFRGG